MDDWQRRIDAWEATHAPARHVRSAVASARAPSPAVPGRPPARRWGQEPALAAHQRRFRCHICRRPSDGPHTSVTHHFAWTTVTDEEAPLGVPDGIAFTRSTHWDQPTGLARCRRCGSWTCGEHLYKQICQRCAVRL